MTKAKHPESEQTPQEDISFEKGFSRLEQILEKMNSNTISLDESLKLYEEADSLIQICGKKLNDAEKKVEILIKNRNGDLLLSNQTQRPQTENFNPGSSAK